MINKSIVAQNMRVTVIKGAVAKIVFFPVALAEGLIVKYADFINYRPFNKQTKSVS